MDFKIVEKEDSSSVMVAELEGKEAGRIDYCVEDGLLHLLNAEVYAPFQSMNVRQLLTYRVFDYAREHHLKVVVKDKFSEEIVEKTPALKALVADAK